MVSKNNIIVSNKTPSDQKPVKNIFCLKFVYFFLNKGFIMFLCIFEKGTPIIMASVFLVFWGGGGGFKVKINHLSPNSD